MEKIIIILTIKNSHNGDVMMKVLKKIMRRNERKNQKNDYVIGINPDEVQDHEEGKYFHKNKNGKLIADVVIIYADDFEKKKMEIDSEIKGLNEEIKILKDKLSAIDEDNQKKINDLKDEYSGKIDKLNEDLHEKDLEIERTKTKYEKDIGVFREEIQKEINHLELFDEDKHIKLSDHNKKVNRIKDKIVVETLQNKDNLNELKNSLSFIRYLKGDYKSIIKDMEEGNEHLKMIAQYSESKNEEILQDVKKEK